jgi:hypothetical protein
MIAAFVFDCNQPNTAQMYFSVDVIVSVMLFDARRELVLAIAIIQTYNQRCIVLFSTNCPVYLSTGIAMWLR